MTTNLVTLNFNASLCNKSGPNTTNTPAQYGVYCVTAKNNAGILRLLYVGRAEDLKCRLSSHEKYHDFINALNDNEELEIHTATVDSDKFKRVEAALIYKFQPPLNNDLLQVFEYQDTTIVTAAGSIHLCGGKQFTVSRSPLRL